MFLMLSFALGSDGITPEKLYNPLNTIVFANVMAIMVMAITILQPEILR